MKIGINGAGRIGRAVLRLLADQQNLDVVGVNDIGGCEAVVHLLKHDSVYGDARTQISYAGEVIQVGRQTARFTQLAQPESVDWAHLGVDVVVEATGRFITRASAARHLREGNRPQRVLVSAVCDNADATVVLGIQQAACEGRVVSNASCTTHAAALPLALIAKWYGIDAADMTTVHCTTGSQVTMDQPHKDLRRARAASLSMIPTSTTASEGLVQVLPVLKNRLSTLAIRVPTAAVSLVELIVQTSKPVDSPAIVRERLVEAAHQEMRGLLGVCDEPLVSADFRADPRSSIVDSELIRCPGSHLLRLIAWYDNEWGYANRLVELLSAWSLTGL